MTGYNANLFLLGPQRPKHINLCDMIISSVFGVGVEYGQYSEGSYFGISKTGTSIHSIEKGVATSP